MERNPEVYKLIHSDFSDIELADIKKAGMAAMDRFVDIVKKDTSHCLSYFLRAGEGLNKKQAKEVLINIGTKPDGFGGVFPYQINTNYFMGGVNELIAYFMDLKALYNLSYGVYIVGAFKDGRAVGCTIKILTNNNKQKCWRFRTFLKTYRIK